MAAHRVADHVAHRTDKPAVPPIQPVGYEKHIYQQGLKFQRSPFTFQTSRWQSQAEERISSESKGYVSTSTGTLVDNTA